MRLVAALCVGLAVASIVAALLGVRVADPDGASGRRRTRSWVERERSWLAQAGLRVSPLRFWSASLAGGALALLVLGAVCGSFLVALVPAAAVAGLPRAYYARRRARRVREVQLAWPDALRDLVASIAAGRSLPHAIETLATTGPPAIQDAFARFPFHVRMFGTAAALEIVKEDLGDATSDRVIEVLILANERGGSIVARILADLVEAISDDVRLADEIETAGLEMKINARAVMVMPWAVLLLLTTIDPAFQAFYRSTGGAVVVAIGLVLTAVGAVVLDRLQRTHAEPRVLVAVGDRRTPRGEPIR